MHQHIFNARFQCDRWARAPATSSLHSQFDYSIFSGESRQGKFQFMPNHKGETKHIKLILRLISDFDSMKENLRIKSPILNVPTIILHSWSNTCLQQFFDHCNSFWVILQHQTQGWSYMRELHNQMNWKCWQIIIIIIRVPISTKGLYFFVSLIQQSMHLFTKFIEGMIP